MYIALDGRRTKPGFYVDQRLNEVSLGEFEGQKRHHIEAFARGDIDFRPPGGESYRTAAQRAFSFYIDLLTSETKTSLVFTHAGIMRIFSSLHFPMHNSVEMFSRDFHNTFCIRVKSNEIKLPRFWLS
jgi:broad specificity phosphatase PhoE